jgi:predicted AlkP superfamily pyrophosphatase or phosphodiesterase
MPGTLTRHLLAALCACALAACRGTAPAPPERPIVILISIDGFRWDYLDRFTPAALTRLAAGGVVADGLIPEFPSKTFPNHYSIVTGLRPANHGIISNNIRDRSIPGTFSLSNREAKADPRWWGGEPIWNTVEKQGLKAGAMFWPGSEAVINGRQASYWTPFDDGMPNRARVDQVLTWLKLPPGQQPAFLTLYFSDVDSAGHDYGPDSRAVQDAVERIDREIAALTSGVTTAGLADRVHYVIVSDHGMAPLSTDRVILLDDYIDVGAADIVDWSPVLALTPKDGNVDAMYAALRDKHPALAVYRSHELPAEFGLAGHPRLPAIVGIAQDGWQIATRRDTARWRSGERAPPQGNHGYDGRLPSMHGLFIANGPRIRRGLRVGPFENIHVYELMCALLRLPAEKNDGDPSVTRGMLLSVQ